MSPLKHSNNFAARMGRWSASHWKTAVFGWLAFVVASFAIGTAVGTQYLKTSDSNVGEAARADKIIKAGFPTKVDEQGELDLHPVQDRQRPRSGLPGRHRRPHADDRPVPAGQQDQVAAGPGPVRPDLEERPLGDDHVHPEGQLRRGIPLHRQHHQGRRQGRDPASRLLRRGDRQRLDREEVQRHLRQPAREGRPDRPPAHAGHPAVRVRLRSCGARAAAAGAHRRHGHHPARLDPEPADPGRRADRGGHPPDRARGRNRLLTVLRPPRA